MRFYKSLSELPLWNFHMAITNEDARYILILEDYYELPKVKTSVLIKQFDKLYSDFMNKFGITPDFQKYMLKVRSLAILAFEAAKDRAMETVYEIEKRRFEQANKNESSFEKQVAIVEKFLKIPIDVKKTSVERFYTYWKLIEEDSKKK